MHAVDKLWTRMRFAGLVVFSSLISDKVEGDDVLDFGR
jgi:hypothetical protein